MKPLEFQITTEYENDYKCHFITFFYEDCITRKIEIVDVPKGIELNRHYAITDLYGYKVVDDRKDF